MEDFNELLKLNLHDFMENESGECSGFTEGEDSYENLMLLLSNKGFPFSIRGSRKLFDNNSEQEPCFHFGSRGGVPMLESPFIMLRHSLLECAHGPKYYKSKSLPLINGEHPSGRKRRSGTKKMDCPVKISVKAVKIFYNFKLSSYTWRAKQKLREELKSRWKEEEFVIRYYFTCSGVHNHSENPSSTQETVFLLDKLKTNFQDLLELANIIPNHVENYQDLAQILEESESLKKRLVFFIETSEVLSMVPKKNEDHLGYCRTSPKKTKISRKTNLETMELNEFLDFDSSNLQACTKIDIGRDSVNTKKLEYMELVSLQG